MALPLKDKILKHPGRTFWIIAVFLFLGDRMVKFIEQIAMEPGSSIPVIKGVFHLTYVRNNGAAFSWGSGNTWVFVVAAVLACLVMFAFWRLERPRTLLPVLGSAMLVAGAVGNAFDRVFFTYVIDIFDARIFNFAIFNVADIAITIGAILLIVWLIFFGGWSGKTADVASEEPRD